MKTQISIKTIRERRNWTQAAMATHFGVDKATVWRWENVGIPNRGVVRKVIEAEWLLFKEDET